jgi:hypothetical protein
MSARSKARAAAGALAVAQPEIGIPVELAMKLMDQVRPEAGTPAAPPSVNVDVGGPESSRVVVIPPRDREPWVKFGKDKVRVLERKGVTIVIPERAPGLTFQEFLEAAAIAGVGAGAWEIYELVHGDSPLSALQKWVSSVGSGQPSTKQHNRKLLGLP